MGCKGGVRCEGGVGCEGGVRCHCWVEWGGEGV